MKKNVPSHRAESVIGHKGWTLPPSWSLARGVDDQLMNGSISKVKKKNRMDFLHHCFCAISGCFLGVLGFEEHTTFFCISKRSMTDVSIFGWCPSFLLGSIHLKWSLTLPFFIFHQPGRDWNQRISLYKTMFWVTSPFTRPCTSTSWNSREKHVIPWLWCKGVYFFCDECILLE